MCVKKKIVIFLLPGVEIVVLFLRCPALLIYNHSFFGGWKSSRTVVGAQVGRCIDAKFGFNEAMTTYRQINSLHFVIIKCFIHIIRHIPVVNIV